MNYSQFEQWLRALPRDRSPDDHLASPHLQSVDFLGDPLQVSAWLDRLPLGIAIYRQDGRTAFLNRVAQEMLGLSSDPSSGIIHPDPCPIFQAGTGRLYAAQALPISRALRGESCIADDLEIRRAGRSLLLEARAVPLCNSQGEVLACVAIFQDITLRRQAERSLVAQNHALRSEITQKTEALHRQKIETQALLDAIPDLIFRVSAQGIYLSYLKTNYLIDLIPPDLNPVGMHVSHLLPKEVAQRKLHYLEQAFATQQIQVYEQQVWFGDRLQHEEVRIVPYGPTEALTMIRDVTDRKSAEDALRQSEARFRAAFDHSAVGSSITALNGQILAVNAACCDLLGYTEAELRSLTFQAVSHPEDLAADLAMVQELIDGKRNSFQMEKRYIRKSGEITWALLSVSLVRDAQQNPLYLLAQMQNITRQKRAEEMLIRANQELEALVNIDGLTQIANRRRFDQHLQQEWNRLLREQQFLSLILFDVDEFKRYNDCYGHQEGDDCLRQLAQITRCIVQRPADLVARYGGEEFGVILPNTDIKGGRAIAEKIRLGIQALGIRHECSRVAQVVTVSLGVTSQIPTSTQTIEALMAQADQALYNAKRRGRNRTVVYRDFDMS
ncbi:diguanylate cyclase [Thermoleptolyngbya sp. M55_K2018_002]|uniref:diguanylate cyclase domain-containing protein n=1 Tax=Thermoleptolyngbya sp. M55_K2018_002 TaxID=2747808 RepID=UPI001A03FF14|nr:diguanylate cyclase [Thermoleptolyngbya sp. M55_K2018_002]HIK40010.1 diguanylate cyclase [Thermoleptolyngbya sp. M55_K2018_002]